jgi:hypothetical protein
MLNYNRNIAKFAVPYKPAKIEPKQFKNPKQRIPVSALPGSKDSKKNQPYPYGQNNKYQNARKIY